MYGQAPYATTAADTRPDDGRHRKVIIIGSGPAAHTAAVYTGRALLKPLLFEGMMAGGVPAGGQLTTTTEVENFPSYPDPIDGYELTQRFRAHSLRCGADILTETIASVKLATTPFVATTEEGVDYTADAIILATGAIAKRLGAPGEERLWNKGVSACAVCDGALPLFRNKPLVVVGGGDSAVEEATFLTRFASHVYMIHRRDALRASKTMALRASTNPKITILWNSVLDSIQGEELVFSVVLRNVLTGARQELPCSGVFYAIGHSPNTAFLGGQVALDEDGYVRVQPGSTRTNVEGVFACGDMADKKFRQAITAAGSGCMAAIEAEHWLSLRA
eukprot:jgi/Mesvir1/14574/Mv05253-RA.1